MIEILIAFLSGFFGPLLRDLVADMRRDQALEDKGAADAALDTARTIQEMADAQRKIEARDRGDAGDVAHRLRDRLSAGG
jgi:hypothetical protein